MKLIAALFLSLGTLAQAQTAYPGIAGSGGGTLPSNGALFGDNGQDRNYNWNDFDGGTGGANDLAPLGMSALRLPAGTPANYWDWNEGVPVINYESATPPFNPGSPQQASKLPEMETEIAQAGTSVKPIWVMNLLTDPTAVIGSSWGGNWLPWAATYKMGMPNLSYQESLLTTAKADGLSLTNVELGNEYYIDATGGGDESAEPGYTEVYPNGTSGTAGGSNYGATAAAWMTSIRGMSGITIPKLSVVAYHSKPGTTATTREANWNSGLSSALSTAGVTPDAVSLHVYQPSNLPSGTTQITAADAEDMLYGPVSAYNAIVATDLPSVPNVPIWITEYNLMDFNFPCFGTWCHGLFTSAMSLEFLQLLQPQVSGNTNQTIQFAMHHDVVGAAIYGDLFETAAGFDGSGEFVFPANGANWVTQQYGQSAVGDAQSEINQAIAGQTQATQLNFGSSAPQITDGNGDPGYAAVNGWIFTGGTDNEVVLANLSSSAVTVNLGGLMTSANSPKYDQIFGDPGEYVNGEVASGGAGTLSNPYELQGYSYSNATSTPDEYLTSYTDVSVSNPDSVSLPAFSLTRISYSSAVPLSFTDVDLHSPSKAGSSSYTSNAWQVKGCGAGVVAGTGTGTDQGHFAYQSYSGATTIVAQVSSESISSSSAQAGLMFRDGTAAGAKDVALVVTNSGVSLFYRTSTNGNTALKTSSSTPTPPCWLKLYYDASNNTYYGYYSTDGVTWTNAGSVNTVTISTSPDVGLLVDSGNDTALNTTVFAGVTVQNP